MDEQEREEVLQAAQEYLDMAIEENQIEAAVERADQREADRLLTKREAFAMAAMQGMCVTADDNERTDEQIARWAVAQADALLKVLEAPDE